MTPLSEELTVEERLSRADELDLEPVTYKLLHPEAGRPPLSQAAADVAVALYRCFWMLCVLYPEQTLVPSRPIDDAWHAHLLDTVKYAADCDRVFGRPLDHFPYAGLRGEADRAAWQAHFDRTTALFIDHFGADLGGPPAASASGHGTGCIGCVRPSSVNIRPRPARQSLVP